MEHFIDSDDNPSSANLKAPPSLRGLAITITLIFVGLPWLVYGLWSWVA